MSVEAVFEFADNPHGVFFAGQVVKGNARLTVNKTQDIQAVLLKVQGYAQTKWVSRRPGSNDYIRYSGYEEYINYVMYVVGTENGPKINLERGTYTYPFVALLPETCPSSVEAAHGRIRYKVKVILERPWKFDKTFQQCFTVLSLFDLNTKTAPQQPAHAETTKTFRFWPLSSLPLRLQISLPDNRYVPGQLIPVSVLINNESDVPIEGVTVKLCMKTQCHSQKPWRSGISDSRTLAKVEGPGVLRNMRKLQQHTLPIPPTPSTSLHSSNIIEVNYQIEVEAKINWKHFNATVSLPVLIGNVPLRSEAKDAKENAGATALPKAVEAEKSYNPPTPLWSGDSSLPPPSYEKAMQVQMIDNAEEPDVEHEIEPADFAPLYPFYNIPNVEALTDEEIDKLFADLELN